MVLVKGGEDMAIVVSCWSKDHAAVAVVPVGAFFLPRARDSSLQKYVILLSKNTVSTSLLVRCIVA